MWTVSWLQTLMRSKRFLRLSMLLMRYSLLVLVSMSLRKSLSILEAKLYNYPRDQISYLLIDFTAISLTGRGFSFST